MVNLTDSSDAAAANNGRHAPPAAQPRPVRFFVDTEFIANGPGEPIHALSIGVVSEGGREYYAQVLGCPLHLANGWVRAHVLPSLEHPGEERMPCGESGCPWKTREQICADLLEFFGLTFDESPRRPPLEFWASHAGYDGVVINQLFGGINRAPQGLPRFCCDLQQVYAMGLAARPQFPAELLEGARGPGGRAPRPHHALDDARRVRAVWRYLAGELPRPDVNGNRPAPEEGLPAVIRQKRIIRGKCRDLRVEVEGTVRAMKGKGLDELTRAEAAQVIEELGRREEGGKVSRGRAAGRKREGDVAKTKTVERLGGGFLLWWLVAVGASYLLKGIFDKPEAAAIDLAAWLRAFYYLAAATTVMALAGAASVRPVPKLAAALFAAAAGVAAAAGAAYLWRHPAGPGEVRMLAGLMLLAASVTWPIFVVIRREAAARAG